MTSSALKVSVISQDKAPSKTSKKATKAKSPLESSAHLSNKNKKTKIEAPTLSLFSQMLLQAQQSPANPPNAKTKTSKNAPIRKTQLIQHQKALLTQNKLKIQNEAPSHKMQNQLREALMIKSDQKTLRDIQKIAQEHQLNLEKIELQKSPKAKKAPKESISKTTQTKPAQEKLMQEKLAQEKFTQEKTTQEKRGKQQIEKQERKNKADLPSLKDSAQPSKVAQNAPLDVNQAQNPAPQNNPLLKDSALISLLATKEKEEGLKNQEKIEEKKSEKSHNIALGEIKKETQFKITQSRETLSHFSQRLKEEIANYKPPFTRLSMELNPQELGKLEITITKKGKELQVNVNANNPNALQVFIQNQSEFRNTLTSIGFNSVELNFSQGDSQKQKGEQEQNQKGNKNSFEENQDISLNASMEIKMVQYA